MLPDGGKIYSKFNSFLWWIYLYSFADFYDPDGYYFNKDGIDEFGGYYKGIYYIPGPGNKHEFEDLYDDEDDYDDELIRQFERGHQEDDEDFEDEIQEKLYREFKQKERELPLDIEDKEEEPYEELPQPEEREDTN